MITIFGSSTAYISFPENGKSYVDLLKNHGYPIDSHCLNGYTIWHANYMLPEIAPEWEDNPTFILHVGACEAITMKSSNFLVMTTYWLVNGKNDEYFMRYFAPKMVKAADANHCGRMEYFRYLEPDEFKHLYHRVLLMLKDFNVLAVGMSNPQSSSDIRVDQAREFDEVIKELVTICPWSKYIDVWNLCAGEVVDSSHLTVEGHRRLFEVITRNLS
jgi:hypothetical protein